MRAILDATNSSHTHEITIIDHPCTHIPILNQSSDRLWSQPDSRIIQPGRPRWKVNNNYDKQIFVHGYVVAQVDNGLK